MATNRNFQSPAVDALIDAALVRAADLRAQSKNDSSEAGALVTNNEAARWQQLADDAKLEIKNLID